MILVVSHEEDPHAIRVIQRLREGGQPVLLFNLAELPNRATLSIEYGRRGRPRMAYVRDRSAPIALDEVTAVWWRRPQAPDLSQVTDPHVFQFTANEWNEAISGLWQLLDVPWMNDPVVDEAASRKARQLRVAADLGLRIPETLITSDPDRAAAFAKARGPGQTIYKTFSCTHQIWRETRLLTDAAMAEISSVRVAPVIFQEFVHAECDLRITAIGGRLFPAAIRSAGRDDLVDFRSTVGEAELTVATLPAVIETKLLALLDQLGLVYGAIDLRRTPSGEYYFFEVNTAGEFLFVEERTGLPISQAVADWLSAPSVSRPARAGRSAAGRRRSSRGTTRSSGSRRG